MADTHHDEPDVPGLPTIQDEAADTPMWVPATGLALLAVMVLMLVYQVAQGPEDAAADEAASAQGADEAAPAEAALPEAPEAPAEDDHAGHGH